MANYVYITLDTTAPTNPVVQISGGAVFTTAQLVTLNVSVDDADKTGYQMIIWGDVDTSYDTKVQATEGASQWFAFSSTPQVKLSSGDALKTINVRVRDDVNNPSSVAVDNITMDTSIPTVTTTVTDVPKVSSQTGKNTFSFTFSANENYTDYKVKLVGATNATESTGTQIPTAGGSTNVSGNAGNYTSAQVITVTIKTADLVTAGANTDGQKIIKVFVKDVSGQWSV